MAKRKPRESLSAALRRGLNEQRERAAALAAELGEHQQRRRTSDIGQLLKEWVPVFNSRAIAVMATPETAFVTFAKDDVTVTITHKDLLRVGVVAIVRMFDELPDSTVYAKPPVSNMLAAR